MLCASVDCWAHTFLQHLRHRSLWIIRETDYQWIPHLMWNFSDYSVAMRFVFLTQQQRLNCVDVFISMLIASASAQTPVDCSKLHQQPVDAVLLPAFVQKLCYKLPSVVTFTFIQTSTFCFLFLNGVKVGDTVSKLALFSVSGWKDKTLWKKPNLHEKMKRAHSLLQSFEYFCQISSKLIPKILCYIVPKLGHFLRHGIDKKHQSHKKTYNFGEDFHWGQDST